jgi:ferrous iron transport protein B
MQLLDLGCYSLQARSPDEAVARDVLLGRQADTRPARRRSSPFWDATNLERNLFLLSQLLELGLPVFLGLDMIDLSEKRGIVIDPRVLSEKLGIPVIPMVASEGVGLVALKQALSQTTLPLPPKTRTDAGGVGNRSQPSCKDLTAKRAQFAEAILLLGMTQSQLAETPHLTQNERELVSQARTRLELAGVDPGLRSR